MQSPSLRHAWRFALLLLSVCATTTCSTIRRPIPATGSTPEPSSLLLISLDGFRADYLDLGITPTLSQLAREGVRARWMTPSYPSLTFPNHYSLVTGLVPDHQGIVHNTMQDSALGGFKLSNRMAVADSRWWGGEPIWVGAEKAGLRSATLFWPGSEAEIDGVRPTRWTAFDESISLDARVDTVVGWMSESIATRPRIATLYFEHLDEASHAYGPDSIQAHAAVRELDAALARLVDGLARNGRLEHTNIIVTSDHGMATVPPGNVIDVESMVTREQAVVVTVGQVITIAPNPGFEAVVEKKLLGKHERYDCWRKGELPARWRYGSHPRIPPIVCQMHEGWDAQSAENIARRPKDHDRGSHGYDPALPSMRAIFVARGPAFREGVVIEPFDNVDVYPLLARLIGVIPAANDGDAHALLPALNTLRDSGIPE